MIDPVDGTAIPKRYRYGTHRFRDPQKTYATISPHFARVGLTRIADITGLDSIGVPVFAAIRPNSKSLAVSQGKGLTPALARVSAAMESLELYHAENVGLPRTRASYRQLAARMNACDPLTLHLDPLSVYHPDLILDWVSGIDLVSDKPIQAPFDLVHCAYLADPLRPPVFLMTSNGLASGNTRGEAISHAICEVIERDASTQWEILNADATGTMGRVDLDTIESVPAREIIEKLQAAGVTPYIWDQRSDVGLPVFGCAVVEHSPERSAEMIGPFTGFGCHLSKEVALLRALTEAVQSRLTYIAGSRDDIYRSDYARLGTRATLQHIQYEPAIVDYASVDSLETDTLEGDIAVQLDHLGRAGLNQVIYVDLSQPDFGISVVRVLIPGTSFGVSHRGQQLPLNAQTKRRLMQRMLLGNQFA